MAFAPMGTIALLNVDFDNTYKHVRYFSSETQQRGYFGMRVKKSYNEYLTVRKTLPTGGMVSSVKVSDNIDTLQALPCNYMYYRNEHHGNKIFYAFITELRYVNENTTEIIFETDVYQTWLFDVEILPSYVVREHSASDEIGYNVTPEKFDYTEYNYIPLTIDDPLTSYGYLVTATELATESGDGSDVVPYQEMSGIFQGLYYYYTSDALKLSNLLTDLQTNGGDCVVSVAVIPAFNVKNTHMAGVGDPRIEYSSATAMANVIVPSVDPSWTFDGYKPRNNKLYTFPFLSLTCSNHNGGEAVYAYEHFNNPDAITFNYYGDISANPSVTAIPVNYNGTFQNYDAGISISGFPQCSVNTDTFKLWLAKNQFGEKLSMLGAAGSAVVGVGMIATGGITLAAGAAVAGGAMGVLNTMNSRYQAQKEPNRGREGSPQNNLLTAMKMNRFEFYARMVKPHHARTIDDFFTMYGYQTNQVKVPNVAIRPSFNYVETIDINIVGGIPNSDMQRLKAIYNSGVTLWKHSVDVGDYAADNAAPIKEVNADA